MVFFPNEVLELFEYVELDELNSYLEPKHEYRFLMSVPCDFQQMSPNDDIKEFGEIQEDSYKIYLDKNVPVTHDMVLRLEGKPDTYEITGKVMHNNHLVPVEHIKLVVKKQRKPTPVVVPEPEPEPVEPEPVDPTEPTDPTEPVEPEPNTEPEVEP